MEIDVTGDVSSAAQGTNMEMTCILLTAGSLVHTVNVGVDEVVMVYQNETDPTDNRSEIRTVMSDDVNNGVWTYSGSVTPDTENGEAAYSVDVSVGGYSMYGQFESCTNT